MNKILIVEDELAYLTLLEDKLKEEGYLVYSATDGQKGLESALKNHPDLILLDIVMPLMDGMTMLTQLRQDVPYGESVKVIMLTNVELNSEIMKKIVKDRPAFYLLKSRVTLMEMAEKIKEILIAK